MPKINFEISQWKGEKNVGINMEGSTQELIQMLYSAMKGDPNVYALLCSIVQFYNMKELGGGGEADTGESFFNRMGHDAKYCTEITLAVLAFWTLAGVDCGRLSEMFTKK